MKYKIGDRVRIKPNITDELHYECAVVEEMVRYAGCSATVISYTGKTYRLSVDNGVWAWSPDTLEGYTGFYIGNHVLVDGVEHVIANIKTLISESEGVDPPRTYQLEDGNWYPESQLGRIEGFGYSKQTRPECFNVGDYVIVRVNESIEVYGGIHSYDAACTRSNHRENNNRIAKIIEHGIGYKYFIDIDSENAYSGYMLEKISFVSPKPGDTVLHMRSEKILTVETVSDETCVLSCCTSDETITENIRDVMVMKPASAMLYQDVYGVGKAGDMISGYYQPEIRKFVVETANFISGELFPEEIRIVWMDDSRRLQ